MTRLRLLLFISSLTILFSQCKQKINQPDIETVLSKTISKYPQLPKGQAKQSTYYRLVRSVVIGNDGVELQLRSTPDTSNDPQQIILVINKAKDIYAIPFFSNTYHDYWDFQFDSVLHAVKPTNTTFEKELKACLTQLKLDDTLSTAGIVINEMLFSLLHCERVTDTDSSNLHVGAWTSNSDLPDEENDSCNKRCQQNWQEMKKAFHPNDYTVNYNAFWDKENNRVYQFDIKNLGRRQKLDFSMRNYRLDCVLKMLSL